MQKDLEATYPVLRIRLLGVNAYGQDAGNGPMTLGRELPWLQDVDADHDGRGDAAASWNANYRDVYILDGANVQVATFDVESKDLNQSANYTALQELLVDAAMTSQKPWRNADEPLDVNDDTRVEPIDALIIINKLNDVGPHTLPPPKAGDPPMRYYDCNGDGDIGPVDALNIINRLNEQNGGTGGEGENGQNAASVATYPSADLAALVPRAAAWNEPLSPKPEDAVNNPVVESPDGGPVVDENRSPISAAAASRLEAGPADSALPKSRPPEQLDGWLAVRAGEEPLSDITGPY